MASPRLFRSLFCNLNQQSCLTRAFLTTSVRLHQNADSSTIGGSGDRTEANETENSLTHELTKETPVMTSRSLRFPVNHTHSRLAWVESMDSLEGTKLGMVDLHPDVFAIYPRIDILHKNVHWQQMYRHIDYSFEPSRAEMKGGGRKPWPQKGMGKARHGSCRSPLWIKGSKAHGPRGPTSYFYMLPRHQRALGLRSALSCKYAQNDLVIVDSLDIPTSESEFLSELADVRFWGYSVLLVDDTDIMPENIAIAADQLQGFNIMPAYGLNVYSMLKHETLVLTLAALERIEGKLLEELHTTQVDRKFINRLRPEDFRTHPKKDGTMLKPFSAPLHF